MKYLVSLTIVSCLLASFSSVPLTEEQGGFLVQESEPMYSLKFDKGSYSNETLKAEQSEAIESSSEPYVAGYMTTNWLWNNPEMGDASALRVTVSFSGTNVSLIQSDNWLAAGITAQGPDSVHTGCAAIDWGYAYTLMVEGNLSYPFVHAEVWECHEWGDDCFHNPWAQCVSSWNCYISTLTISSSTTLTMSWGENALDYYAKVGEHDSLLLYSYTPNASAIHDFKLGTVDRKWWIIPLGGTVKYFEFPGAWSRYNIGHVGWRSRISFPAFIKSGETCWTNVAYAYSTNGANAFLDNTFVWGGDSYANVDAAYYYKNWPYPNVWPCEQIYFYPTSDGTTLAPDTLLWDPYATQPPGGCPYISDWNGTEYVLDNNLLAASDHGSEVDINDYYRLGQKLVPRLNTRDFSLYSLMLKEFENEHSYFDKVQFTAVGHSSDVGVAVDPNGEILTYTKPYAPQLAIDDKGLNITNLIESSDGDYYQGYNGSFITLYFRDLDTFDGAKLVMRADDGIIKESIHIQILNETGGWHTIAKVIPRAYWAIEIVNLAPWIVNTDGDLSIRLYFTTNHKIDYIGLDTSSQATLDVKRGNLVFAKHSTDGYVTGLLQNSDEIYAELFPGQQIELAFITPKVNGEERDYIIAVEGYYATIP